MGVNTVAFTFIYILNLTTSQLLLHYHFGSSNHQLQSGLSVFSMPLPAPSESIHHKAATTMVTHGNLKPHHVTLQLNTVPYHPIVSKVQNKIILII